MVCCSLTRRADNSFIQQLPMLTPAVRRDGLDVDHELLAERTSRVFWLTMVKIAIAVGVSLTMPQYEIIALIAATAIAIWGCVTIALDRYLSNRAADRNAVGHFRSQPVPSAVATHRIVMSSGAFGRFLKSGVDFNKVDEKGRRVGDVAVPMFGEVSPRAIGMVRALLKGGMHVRKADVFEAAERASPELLQLLFKEGASKPNDLSGDDQVDLWTVAGSVDAMRTLHRIGFDVNVTDRRGYTPLHAALERGRFTFSGLDRAGRIRTLLGLGADPAKGPSHRLLWTYYPELATRDPELVQILREAREKKNQ